jgi:glycosyltransferase involved in cell wall biosynthesis
MRKLPTQQEVMQQWGATSQPLVSISCLTFNHQDYLEDALEGFLRQTTNFPFEILIHDDASTDGTANIIREYETAYPIIVRPLYQKENQYSKGVRISDTYQFPRAKGKYIAICEGDDYWVDPLKLQTQVDFLENNPDYVVCYTNCQPFDAHGLLDTDFLGRKRDLEAIELQRATPIFTLTACFRNVLKGAPREFAIVEYGDLTFWCRLGDFGKGKYLPNIKPSMYRVHGGGVHSARSEKQRAKMRLQLMVGMLLYRLNRDDTKLASHFAVEVMVALMRTLSWGLLPAIAAKAMNAARKRLLRFRA